MDDKELAEFVRTYGSREKAVEFPINMNVLPYVFKELIVPRYPALETKENQVVYHYTDAGGLIGILGSHRFWATHWSFLNDPTDGRHGVSVVKEALSTMANSADTPDLFSSAMVALDKPSTLDAYVVSFCKEGDLLSQWRGYGAFGGGYALGFELNKLVPHPQVGSLVEIIYSDEVLASVLAEVASIYKEHISIGGRGSKYHDDLGEMMAGVLSYTNRLFKHPSYESEQEARLIYTEYANPLNPFKKKMRYDCPVRFRAKGPNIIPFLEGRLTLNEEEQGPLPLREVVLGPGVPKQNVEALNHLLHQHGYENVDIRFSAIPFTF